MLGPLLAPKSVKPHVLLLNRSNRRSILNFDSLADAVLEVSTKFDTPVQVIGPQTPSLYDQMNFWASATAVVLVHGAAMTNAIFLQDKALILEITSYATKRDKGIWRCGPEFFSYRQNKSTQVQIDTDIWVEWILIMVSWEHMVPPPGNVTNAFFILQDRDLRLTKQHCDEISQRLGQHLASTKVDTCVYPTPEILCKRSAHWFAGETPKYPDPDHLANPKAQKVRKAENLKG
mmetsp:Transcript_32004/g.50001  ORF Transcript_32004/g.50001 Transcript_32004/m.50001 type:complete len:233 (+) Transcript_32004:159-857(+)